MSYFIRNLFPNLIFQRLADSTVVTHYINITFPERVIVENIILRNMIINRGAAEVDSTSAAPRLMIIIFRGMIFSTITLSGNVIFILLYQTEH